MARAALFFFVFLFFVFPAYAFFDTRQYYVFDENTLQQIRTVCGDSNRGLAGNGLCYAFGSGSGGLTLGDVYSLFPTYPVYDANIGSVSQTKIFDSNNTAWLRSKTIWDWNTASSLKTSSLADLNGIASIKSIAINDWNKFATIDANMVKDWNKNASMKTSSLSDLNGTGSLKQITISDANNLGWLSQKTIGDANNSSWLKSKTIGDLNNIAGIKQITIADANNSSWLDYVVIANAPWLTSFSDTNWQTSFPVFDANMAAKYSKIIDTNGADNLLAKTSDINGTYAKSLDVNGADNLRYLKTDVNSNFVPFQKASQDVNLGTGALTAGIGTFSGLSIFQNGLRLGTAGGNAPYIFPFSGSSYTSPSATGTNTTFYTYSIAGNNYGVVFAGETVTATSNVYYNFVSPRLFQPASGDAIFVTFAILGGVNQSAVGAPTGITRGLWVNQTLTSPYDYRAIETSNSLGYAFYGAGTAPIYLKGAINSALALTTVNGSVGGTAIWSMPFQGASYKKFAVNMQALNSTTKTITYPVVFLTQPYIYGDAAALAVSSTNTTTFTITTPAVITGSVFVEGY